MFSIVMPMDTNRLEQFKETKRAYDEMPQKKEFIIPTRSEFQIARFLDEHKLMKDVRIISYGVEAGFNCSKALNIGVREAKYDSIVITSPEVKPLTDVLHQFSESLDKNIICEVSDQDIDGNLTILVGNGYRDDTPAMYFLAKFNKADVEKINGWDEEFMKGYAYEDNDFGARWNRAGLPFELHMEIKAVHQYHPRGETIPDGLTINERQFQKNNADGVVYCKNGLNATIDPTRAEVQNANE
jgi:hypothetical protein